ncbi:hypothetical protein M0Q97_12415 [Candidatus Dojkabacteria bacterium]|jgi:hypothetical protein|nr:hypothetical protein [Candidatus Dojkabacteria bacterium]
MKNILRRDEFKHLYNQYNESNPIRIYDKLYEAEGQGMDFSNRTGWSQSLVGRAINKIFSFGKTIVDKMVLSSLKEKLENEYFKGVMRAVAQNNIAKENIQKANLMVSVYLIKKEDVEKIKTDFDSVEKHEPTFNKNTFKFSLPNLNFDDWMFVVIPESEVKINTEDVKIKYNEKVKFEISDTEEKSKEEYYILCESTETKNALPEKTTTQNGMQLYKPDQNVTIIKNNVKEKDIKVKDVSDDIIKSVDGQSYPATIEIGNDLKMSGSVPTDLYKILEGILTNLQTLKKHKHYDKFKNEINNEINNLKKLYINNNLTKDELTKVANRVAELILKMNETELALTSKSYKSYNDFIIEKKLNEEQKALTTGNGTIANTNQTNATPINNQGNTTSNKQNKDGIQDATIVQTQAQTAQAQTVQAQSDEQKEYDVKIEVEQSDSYEEQTPRITVGSIFNTGKLTDADKDLKKEYGSLKLGEINSESLLKNFQENPKLRKLAISLVNKEALKEIALRAAWLYDDEKYKDKRVDIYSRVNFATTGTDMNKLKNNWLKKVAATKAQYTPFFADESGNFPGELDPIALMNSDETFRTKFNQYDENELRQNGNVGPVVGTKDATPASALIKYGKLNPGAANTDNFGLFVLKTTAPNRRRVGMLYQNLGRKDEFIFKFVGLIDYDNLDKELKDNMTEQQTKDLIKKYHYTETDGVREFSSPFPDDDNEIKLIYKAYRGQKDLLKKATNSEVKSKDFTVGYFKTKNIITGGPQRPNQIILFTKDNWNTVETYISKIEKGDVVSYELLESLNNPTPDKYHFSFNVDKVYSIGSEVTKSVWGIVTLDSDKKRNEKLKDPNIFTQLRNKKLI